MTIRGGGVEFWSLDCWKWHGGIVSGVVSANLLIFFRAAVVIELSWCTEFKRISVLLFETRDWLLSNKSERTGDAT